MSSIHNIPEPTTGYRPVAEDTPTAPPPPLRAGADRRPDCAQTQDRSRPMTEVDEEVGGLTWLVVLLISGFVSRLALWFFGPWQGIAEDATPWAGVGEALIRQGPSAADGAMPVVPLLAYGMDRVGVPLWALSALQLLLGMVAVAAVYHVGRRLTGRCLAGLGAAALLALHPGVLTWTTAVSPGGLACGLVVIGLYLLARGDEKEPTNPWPGAAALGVAALTAPAAWVVGLGAACWCVAKDGGRRGVLNAAILLLFTLGPAAGWMASSGASPAPGWVGPRASAAVDLPPVSQLTEQSLQDMGAQLRFRMRPEGALAQASDGRADAPADRDPVADLLGEAWVALNTAVLLAAAVGLGLLVLRRRIAAAACFALPVLAYLASGLPLDEPARVALFGPIALLAFGWLGTRVDHALSPEAREALEHENELKRQAKLESRRLRHEKKHGLYAFDKPKKAARRQPAAEVAPVPDATPAAVPPTAPEPAVATEEDPPPPAMMRPI